MRGSVDPRMTGAQREVQADDLGGLAQLRRRRRGAFFETEESLLRRARTLYREERLARLRALNSFSIFVRSEIR